MKYVVIILGGAADEPIEELDHRTPIEAAALPNLNHLASIGRVGAAATTPQGHDPADDTCVLSILGYDPEIYTTGQAPLEALGRGITLNNTDWALHLTLLSVVDEDEDPGRVVGVPGSDLTPAERDALLADLLNHWKRLEPDACAQMRTAAPDLLIDAAVKNYTSTSTTPPTVIMGEPWRDHVPGGGTEGAQLRRMVESSADFLSQHPINTARVEQGLHPANLAWLWGGGRRATAPAFAERFKVRPSIVATDPLMQGISSLIGAQTLPLRDGAGLDTVAQIILDGLRRSDLVCCRVAATQAASFAGDWQTKVAVLEAVDSQLIGPVHHELSESYGDPQRDPSSRGWRLLVIADSFALCETRRHEPSPVPFVMAGAWVRSAVQRPFTESAAAESDLFVEPGHDIMEYFLRGGLAAVRAR